MLALVCFQLILELCGPTLFERESAGLVVESLLLLRDDVVPELRLALELGEARAEAVNNLVSLVDL